MSGVLGSLAAVGSIAGPVARAIEAVANAFGLSQKRAADADMKTAGATAAEDETMQDTAEIADAQARVNSERRDVLDIARELRDEADASDGGGGAKPTGDASRAKS